MSGEHVIDLQVISSISGPACKQWIQGISPDISLPKICNEIKCECRLIQFMGQFHHHKTILLCSQELFHQFSFQLTKNCSSVQLCLIKILSSVHFLRKQCSFFINLWKKYPRAAEIPNCTHHLAPEEHQLSPVATTFYASLWLRQLCASLSMIFLGQAPPSGIHYQDQCTTLVG